MFFKNSAQYVPKKVNIMINVIAIFLLAIMFCVICFVSYDNDNKKKKEYFDKGVGQVHENLEQIESFVSIIGLNSFVKEIATLSTENNADPYIVSQLLKNVNYFNAMLGQNINIFIIFKNNGFSCDYEMYDKFALMTKKYNVTEENVSILNECISTHNAYNKLILKNEKNAIYLSDYTDCNILVSFIISNEFFNEIFADLPNCNGVLVSSHGNNVWGNDNTTGSALVNKIRICDITIKYFYSFNYRLVLWIFAFSALFSFLVIFSINILTNKMYERIRYHIKRVALKANLDLPEDSVDLLTYVDMATENIGEIEQTLEKEIEQKYKNIRQIYLRLLVINDYIEKYSFAWDSVGLEQIGYYTLVVTENSIVETEKIIEINENVYLCKGEKIEINAQGKVGLSSTVRDLTRINKCYLEAIKAINYAFLMEKDMVYYDELENVKSSELDALLFEFKSSVGVECEKTKKIIENLFELFEKDKFNLQVILAIQELEEYLSFSNKFYTQQNNHVYNVSLKELKEIVLASVYNISVNYAIKKDKEKEKIFSLIKTHIDENIFNPNLSLNFIGIKIGYSISQISKIVSDNIGINFNDYISRCRVEKAKELLLSGSTVNKIVETCGFGSLATFRRLFKKYTGMTPQQFKILGFEKQ